MHVLERLTEAERRELQELRREWEIASETLATHQKAKGRIESDLHAVNGQAGRNTRATFAAYLDGKPAPQVAIGPSKPELDDALKGAAAVLREDQESVEKARGALRARTAAVTRACADRMALELVMAAARVRALWGAIAGAHTAMASVTGQDPEIVDPFEWRKLYVPGGKALPSLASAGFDMGDAFHTRVLFCGADQYEAIAGHAAAELEQAIVAAAGVWPFGARTTIASASNTSAGTQQAEREEASRKSRRAVLEQAAEKGIT